MEAAWLEAREIMIRKGPVKGPRAGFKHYFSNVAKELWTFVKPDAECYKIRLERLGALALKQFNAIGENIHPATVPPLIMKRPAKALRERATHHDTNKVYENQAEAALRVSRRRRSRIR